MAVCILAVNLNIEIVHLKCHLVGNIYFWRVGFLPWQRLIVLWHIIGCYHPRQLRMWFAFEGSAMTGVCAVDLHAIEDGLLSLRILQNLPRPTRWLSFHAVRLHLCPCQVRLQRASQRPKKVRATMDTFMSWLKKVATISMHKLEHARFLLTWYGAQSFYCWEQPMTTCFLPWNII